MNNKTRFSAVIGLLTILLSLNGLSQSWNDAVKEAERQATAKNFSSALATIDKALTIAKNEFGEKSVYYAQSLSKKGEIYYQASNFDNAITNFIQSKDLYKELGKDSEPAYAVVINNLSVAYQQLGRYGEAEPYLLESIRLKKEKGLKNDPSYARSLNNLGQLYQELSRYDEAEPLLLEALEIKARQEGENSVSYATSLLNLAILYKALGNHAKAEKILEKSTQIFAEKLGDNHPETVKSRLNLAMVYFALGKGKEAEPLLEKTKSFSEGQVNKNTPDYASTLFNLAMLRWTMNSYDEAIKLLKEAIGVLDKSTGNSHPLYAKCLNSLGVIYWIKDDFTKAEEYLKNAVYLRKMVLGENHPDYATSIHNYAGFLKDIGKFEEAEKNYHLAFSLYLDQIRKYFAFLSESERMEFYSTLKERFEMFNCYVVMRQADNRNLAGDMYNYQLATKALLLNSTKKVRNTILASKDEKLIGKYNEWRSLKAKLALLYSLSQIELQQKRINIDSIETVLNVLEKELSKSSSEFSREIDQRTFTWQDVQKKLKPNEAAVEIIRFRFFEKGWTKEVFYAALILTSETKDYPELVLLKNGNDLEQLYMKNYANSISHKITDNDSYKVFWEKIEQKIPNKSIIYLSPDGIYNKLNINTLLRPDGSFIIDNKHVRLVTNTSDLLSEAKAEDLKKGDKNAFLFGFADFGCSLKHLNQSTENIENPDFVTNDRSATPINIPSLPETKTEVENIGKLLSSKSWKVKIFTGDEASENNLKSLVNPDILHIATHGYFLDERDLFTRKKAFGIDVEKAIENPLLRSGLLFSGSAEALSKSNLPPVNFENGILYSYEAMNLNLDKTRLVVLSACETALGEIMNGEGVFGLQRSLQVAGADKIIMTLWKIDDKASQELMTDFYENWTKGTRLTDAFREAELKMKEKYKHPYYWGAFVAIGR